MKNFIEQTPEAANMILSNAHGETLFNLNDATELDLSGMPPGIYMLSIFDKEGRKIKTEQLSYLG